MVGDPSIQDSWKCRLWKHFSDIAWLLDYLPHRRSLQTRLHNDTQHRTRKRCWTHEFSFSFRCASGPWGTSDHKMPRLRFRSVKPTTEPERSRTSLTQFSGTSRWSFLWLLEWLSNAIFNQTFFYVINMLYSCFCLCIMNVHLFGCDCCTLRKKLCVTSTIGDLSIFHFLLLSSAGTIKSPVFPCHHQSFSVIWMVLRLAGSQSLEV
jgi:hypothetical protein